jgi:hypothetical protein
VSKTIKQIDFMVPGLKTVSELNSREHWGARNRRKQDQQQLVAVAMSNALARRTVELPCVVRLTRIGPKKLDEGDNLSSAFKGIRDQIARQLGVDDGGDQVQFQYAQMPIGSRDYAVKVEISSRANTSQE